MGNGGGMSMAVVLMSLWWIGGRAGGGDGVGMSHGRRVVGSDVSARWSFLTNHLMLPRRTSFCSWTFDLATVHLKTTCRAR